MRCALTCCGIAMSRCFPAFALSLILAGCGGDDNKSAALLLTNAPVASADEPKQEWGSVKGQVIWGDKNLPEPVKLEVTKDQNVCLKDGPVLSEEFIVDKTTKGVKNAFVWLAAGTVPKKGEKWAKIPIHPSLAKSAKDTVTLDQPCCSFVPHVLAMRADQTLEIKNSASVPHNIHLIGRADFGLNKIMPPASTLTETIPAEADLISVQCDIHGWMKGYIHVFDHPYFAVTGADGKFEIKNAPAGDYRIIIWQEGMGWVAFDGPDAAGKNGKKITIKANGETDLGTFPVSKPKD
jgi:hypothetical protein